MRTPFNTFRCTLLKASRAVPGAYTIDEPHEVVLSRAWGVLTDADLLTHARTLSTDPRYRTTFRQIADLREVTDLEITSAVVRQMAQLSPFTAGSRRALVVGTDVAYGMARMFQILRGPVADEIHIFRHMEPALEWLHLSDVEEEVLDLLANAPPRVVPHAAPV